MHRTFRYRLYPTSAQAETLDRQLALCCELYNAALQERRDAWRVCRVSIGARAQRAQLSEIKTERPEFKGVYAQVLQDVLLRVDGTFKAFFTRVKRSRSKAGFPRFRSSSRYDSLTYPQHGFAVEARHLKLSKIGRIKIKLHRETQGQIKTLTVKREATKWYASFSVDRDTEPLPPSSESIGVDVGLLTFATLSDGTKIENPRYYREAQAKLRTAQRRAARRRKGSRRRRQAINLLRSIHIHIRNQRADFHHRVARSLVNQYGFIAVENLNIKGLAQSNLAKSICDAGWSSFINKLLVKAEEAGRVVVKVDPHGTSQACLCGASVPKTLSQRWHSCQSCGLSAPRDHVSARLILGRGLRLQSATWPARACVL